MKHIVFLLALLALPAVAQAQTDVPAAPAQLTFKHDGANVDGYALYNDGVRSDLGAIPVTATCTGCDATSRVFTLPALTPGTHQLTVAAYKNSFGESTKSNILVLRVIVISTPTGLRILSASVIDPDTPANG